MSLNYAVIVLYYVYIGTMHCSHCPQGSNLDDMSETKFSLSDMCVVMSHSKDINTPLCIGVTNYPGQK